MLVRIGFCTVIFSIFAFTNLVFASEIHHSPKEVCKDDSIETASKGWLSFGGEQRLRGDFTSNLNLGDFSYAPTTQEEQLISRSRLHMTLEPAEFLQGFIEGQYYTRQGDSDYSKWNLYKAYVELSGGENIPLNIRIGRQGFCYGSAFFLGENDFYEGLVWDGVKINVAPSDDFWVDLIAARYVKLNENDSSTEPALYGLYSSRHLKKDIDLDVYFFYHKGGFKFFHDDHPDGAEWFTLGTRFAGKATERFDYEIEPLYQFGKIDNASRGGSDTIEAYGGHFEAGYTFDVKWQPRVFAGYAFGSGDNDTSDKKFREFHGNIYNDNYIVGDESLVPDLSGLTVGDTRASGMHIGVVGVSADVLPRLNFNLDWHYFVADKTPAGVRKHLGNEVNFIAAYEVTENFHILLSANRFFTAGFFEDAAESTKDINYFYVQTQFNF